MKLEGEITYSELLSALKKMKNCKSPGNDGFTSEFFKFFWSDIGVFILRSLNYAYKSGSLSVTQKQGIITCIPKPNKSRHLLKNWRPISLLNVIYKLASSVIANRIKTVLDSIVHEDQKGFISGRFIGENIRLIYDILFETKQHNIPGLLLSIDFQQAFDSVSWKFISKTLDYFNFGPSLKKWIKLFENGAESCILQNGFLSDFFYLQRGCRQGDPVSPYLFILCAEVLSLMLRKENAIKGIDINDKSYLLSQYADDTQIFLDGSETSLKVTLGLLKKFYKMSGLKINEDKTKALWIGSMSKSDLRLCREYKLDWEQGPIKILGVTFTPEVFNIWDLNSRELITKMEKVLQSWSKRKLTLPGKITVIKSLAFSKFIHLFTALPNPPDQIVKQLDRHFYKFLWNSGPDRIKRNVMIQDVKDGGLKMINTNIFIQSLKVSWLRRILLSSNECSWNTLSHVDFKKLLLFGDGYAKRCIINLSNPFWIDVISSWKAFYKKCDTTVQIEDILNTPIWFNSELHHGENFYIKQWYEKGIRNKTDLITENGTFYDFNEFKTVYNIRGTVLDFHGLLGRIPNSWKNILNNNAQICAETKYSVVSSKPVKLLLKDKKGCRKIYETLIKSENSTQDRWQRDLGEISKEERSKYNEALNDIKEVKLKDFQFKINNKILATNSFLCKINKIDNNKCSFCEQEPETIKHLFVDCPKVKEFWESVKCWLQTHGNLNLNITDKALIFAWQKEKSLINQVIIIAKYYIYKTKFTSKRLSILGFQLLLKRKFKNEQYIARINNNYNKFLGKWSSLFHVLNVV